MENTPHADEASLENARASGKGTAEQTSQVALLQAGEPAIDPAQCGELMPTLSAVLAPVAEMIPEPSPLPDHLRQIPFRLELRVPLSRFTLCHLQQLKLGDLLLTEHLSVRDLVLTAAGERLLLVELETIEQQLAARVKRLAWRHKWRRQA